MVKNAPEGERHSHKAGQCFESLLLCSSSMETQCNGLPFFLGQIPFLPERTLAEPIRVQRTFRHAAKAYFLKAPARTVDALLTDRLEWRGVVLNLIFHYYPFEIERAFTRNEKCDSMVACRCLLMRTR